MKMKRMVRVRILLIASIAAIAATAHAQLATAIAPDQLLGHVKDSELVIGGQQIVKLTRAATSTTHPEFTGIVLAPGRGMEILQITANFPGKGNVDVLAPTDLATAKKMLDVDDDATGSASYKLGTAFLAPYPNRIRGTLSADSKTITTQWQGRSITLPANNIGKLPTAERHAMHGLILKTPVNHLEVKHLADGSQQITGVIHGGDFGGHWLSNSDLRITITLSADAVDASVEARNVGSEPEPFALAWHPYFNLPSGDRTQARILIPGASIAEVDNYDNVFPTGKILPVAQTRFDLSTAGGVLLKENFYDDNWSDLTWKQGMVTVQIIDPAAGYGLRIEGLSPQIKTIQMYAPPSKSFVAIEHQYNFADPFSSKWGGKDTAMVTLKPGESTAWHVRLKVFVP
jgi:galactose mutarotase-like enzyme